MGVYYFVLKLAIGGNCELCRRCTLAEIWFECCSGRMRWLTYRLRIWVMFVILSRWFESYSVRIHLKSIANRPNLIMPNIKYNVILQWILWHTPRLHSILMDIQYWNKNDFFCDKFWLFIAFLHIKLFLNWDLFTAKFLVRGVYWAKK